ncbi:MAG: hypothetical protein J6T10_15375 [Methanobrevibacter sp.]|nr:hypothetical protein [Methanobrevibacter sp.]
MKRTYIKVDYAELQRLVKGIDEKYDAEMKKLSGDNLKQLELAYKQSGIIDMFCWLITKCQFVVEGEDDE